MTASFLAFPYKRAFVALCGTLLLYLVLVLPHRGEFWPFSVYPMYSEAGTPWNQVIVREVTDEPFAWPRRQVSTVTELPGKPFPLRQSRVRAYELSPFISNTDMHQPSRLDALRGLFGEQLEERSLLIVRVQGNLDGRDSMHVQFTPYVLLRKDTALVNPELLQ